MCSCLSLLAKNLFAALFLTLCVFCLSVVSDSFSCQFVLDWFIVPHVLHLRCSHVLLLKLFGIYHCVSSLLLFFYLPLKLHWFYAQTLSKAMKRSSPDLTTSTVVLKPWYLNTVVQITQSESPAVEGCFKKPRVDRLPWKFCDYRNAHRNTQNGKVRWWPAGTTEFEYLHHNGTLNLLPTVVGEVIFNNLFIDDL